MTQMKHLFFIGSGTQILPFDKLITEATVHQEKDFLI